MKAPNVLFVVTSCDRMNGGEPTGIWLSEFSEPYEVFREAGYHVSVVSIRGGKAPIDPRSMNSETEAKWPDAIARLNETTPIRETDWSAYDAVFLPGGHGTMFDLPDDSGLQQLIREFIETDRIVAAVCHGPASFVNVTLSDGRHLVEGKKITSFTNEEERAAGLEEHMPFLLEDRLRKAGAVFVAEPKWVNHVEADGKLVTGQNPQSSEAVAQKVVELLTGEKVW